MTRRKTSVQPRLDRNDKRPATTLSAAVNKPTKKARSGKDDQASKVEKSIPSSPTIKQQLATSEARVRELEDRLAAVSDRVAWISDRLHDLLEVKK